MLYEVQRTDRVAGAHREAEPPEIGLAVASASQCATATQNAVTSVRVALAVPVPRCRLMPILNLHWQSQWHTAACRAESLPHSPHFTNTASHQFA